MISLNMFIDYLKEQVGNRSIYVWGAQGQDHKVISETWITKKETSKENAQRAIVCWEKRVQQGYGSVLKAFDCSGLAVYFLGTLHGVLKGDMSANSLMHQCEMIQRGQLQSGDWVFRVYQSGEKKGKAYHIGYIVDNRLNVIEAKGRDDGVIEAQFDQTSSYWNEFGRPHYFELNSANRQEDIAHQKSVINSELPRILKITSPFMRGDDVKAIQLALISKGYDCGDTGADGVYGRKTELAVRMFQIKSTLVADGKVGSATLAALVSN